jgi:multiple sugar transport system permease protein
MVIALVYFLLPLAWLVISATKSNSDLFSTFGLAFAKDNFVSNLRAVASFDGGVFFNWLENTFFYAATSAVGAAIVSTLAGYAFAVYRFNGRNTLLGVILLSVAVPVTILTVPLFLLLSAVHLVNTPLAIILPSMVSPFGVFLIRIFAGEALPIELLEAARVDGASEMRTFRKIALPMIMPGFVTVLLFSFIATWNNYLLPLLVFSSPRLFPLTVGLGDWNAQATSPIGSGASIATFNMVITGSLISIIPLLLLFFFLQRYWRQGLTVGAVKG